MCSGIDWVSWGLWVTGGVAGGVFSTPSEVELDVGRGLDATILRGIASNSGKMGDQCRWVLVAEDDEQ